MELTEEEKMDLKLSCLSIQEKAPKWNEEERAQFIEWSSAAIKYYSSQLNEDAKKALYFINEQTKAYYRSI